MKIFRVHTASRIQPKELQAIRKSDLRNGGEIFIGSSFWGKIFDPAFCAAQLQEASSFDQNFWQSKLFLQLAQAREVFLKSLLRPISNEDLTFCFGIFSEVLSLYTKIFPNWEIRLHSGPLHISHGFDENTIEFSWNTLPSLSGERFFQETIKSCFDWSTIRNSVVVFDFFWTSELTQIFGISRELKAQWNTVIIDATKANEQGDHAQWISIFEKNPSIFGYFDYFIPYQDYGIALEKLLSALKEGRKDGIVSIANIVSQGTWSALYFTKPKAQNIAKDELFSAFERYSFDENTWRMFFGEKVFSTRMLPYKCHWSGCSFCTINSTHIFPYDANSEAFSRYVDRLIRFVKEQNITTLILQDEAIRAEDIRFFAQSVIQAGLSKFQYRFRTRFDRAYTEELCGYLAKSGATFVGIGLECASDRLDTLINKGTKLSITEKEAIIGNFHTAGIGFHSYAIFGLPTETIPEMRDTFVFLRKHLESSSNFGCTTNTFGLNRGSEMYRNPEKFGLSYESSENTGALNIRIDQKIDETFHAIRYRFITELLRTEFLPFSSEEGDMPLAYWKFIDYTGPYYFLRWNIQRENLFRMRWNRSKILASLELEVLASKKFEISPYLEIQEAFGGYQVRDISILSKLKISDREAQFLRNFSNKKDLAWNLWGDTIWSMEECIRKCIASGILYEPL